MESSFSPTTSIDFWPPQAEIFFQNIEKNTKINGIPMKFSGSKSAEMSAKSGKLANSYKAHIYVFLITPSIISINLIAVEQSILQN